MGSGEWIILRERHCGDGVPQTRRPTSRYRIVCILVETSSLPLKGDHESSPLLTEDVISASKADFAEIMDDTVTTANRTEAQAIALGLPPQEPVIHAIAELPWSDLIPVKISADGLSGNIADGAASGALAQWEATLASDGHYVLYEIPEAMAQAAQFLRNLADDPKGRVPPR